MRPPVKPSKYTRSVISYPALFTKEECEKILSYPRIFLGNYFAEKKDNNEGVSASSLTLNSDNGWIGERIIKKVIEANNLYFNFDISYLDELHVLEYAENSFFDWHIDMHEINEILSTRKISVIIFLAEREDYEGGELFLHLDKDYTKPHDIIQEIGSIVLFPAYLPHCIKTVTKGIRRTLVCWIHGNHFR
jgi:predicted 2-oxoglutarate/Fe(II)-dependent dioxygenase YbiX